MSSYNCFLGDFDSKLFGYIIGSSTLLSFIVIAIPLGSGESLSKAGFVVNQLVYIWLSFNFLRMAFELSVPGIPNILHSAIFISSTIFLILFYVLYFSDVMNTSLGITRVIPQQVFLAFFAIGYYIHINSQRPYVDPQLHNGETTLSPLRNILISNQISTQQVNNLEEDTEKNSQAKYSISIDHMSEMIPNNRSNSFRLSMDGDVWRFIVLDLFGVRASIRDMEGVHILWSWYRQYLCALGMVSTTAITYFYCQYLALSFSAANTSLGEVQVYTAFVLSFNIIRPIAKQFGYLVDIHKTGGPSLELFMEITISFFYFTFYRNLFISIKSYSSFFTIKSIHVFFEMINYTIIFSKWYQEMLTLWLIKYKDYPLVVSILRIHSGCHTTGFILPQIQCLKVGVRLYLFLSSIITFVLFFTFLRFGYNKNYYCLYAEISSKDYKLLMTITLISFVIELLVFGYTDYLCMTTNNCRILSTWQRLLRGQIAGSSHVVFGIALIWIMTHITTDIYLSRIDVSSIGGVECPEI